jgi:hypothetical protein
LRAALRRAFSGCHNRAKNTPSVHTLSAWLG